MKKIYLLALVGIFANITEMQAYDFSALDVNGNTIYYNYLGGDSVEVTYMKNIYISYSGNVIIPTTVNEGTSSYRVTSIGEYAFYLCDSLKSVDISSSSIRTIGKEAFYGCSSLSTMTIPEGVLYIGDQAFSACTSLTTIYISSTVASLGKSLFSQCEKINSINVDSNNKYYSSLDGVLFDKELTELMVYPIGKDGSIYNIPTGVTRIAEQAFNQCENLTSVEIPNSVTYIGASAFRECRGLTSIEIPNSVTFIGTQAFEICTNLSYATIPSSVTFIGESVFSSSTNLTSINVDPNNTYYSSVDGVLFNKDKSKILAYPAGKNELSYIIPNSVTSIENDAFYYCSNLVSIDIPNNVTNIGRWAFYYCSSLTSIMIPQKVTTIKNYAFYVCNKLDTVICKAIAPPSLGNTVFENISPTAVLLVPYESIDDYKAIAGYADFFAEIKGFSDVEDITDTSATLKWIPDTAVVQYDINVYTGGAHFAQYIVDANGQIISSQLFAPSIYQKLDSAVSSTEYFVISLDGLSAGTNYSYTIDGINAQSAPIYHEAGSFTTLDEGEEGLFDITSDDPRKQARKILYNGQIFILRGEKVYTVTGQEVK